MWIHLFRHGIAIDHSAPSCPPDPLRFLTPKGIARTAAAARGLAALDLEIDAIVVSPFVRAVQTADIVVETLGLEDRPRYELDALVPMGEPSDVVSALGDLRVEAPLLVGHAPNLDRVTAYLIGSHTPVTGLKKAGFCSVRAHALRPGAGALFAVHPPSVLRRLDGRS